MDIRPSHSKPDRQCRTQSGFTLVELVVVMSMVVLLASAAVPHWEAWLQRGRRHEATTELMRGLLWVERHRQTHGTSPPEEAWPASLQTTPQGHYEILWKLQENQQMAFEATPQGAQVEDPCGVLVLWETGEREVRTVLTTHSEWSPSYDNDHSAPNCWAGR